MPIFEFKCKRCNYRFEELLSSMNNVPEKLRCPNCGSAHPQKLMSTFSAQGIKPVSASTCNTCTSGSCNTCSR